MKKLYIIIIVLIYSCAAMQESYAFWIWTPKSNKFVNPKHVAKDTPEEQYEWAMKFFKEKDYKRSAEEFGRLSTYFKESDLAPDAQYYAGVSYEKAGKPYPAFVAYQKTVDMYPFTKRLKEIIEKEYDLGRLFYEKHSGKLMGKEIMTDLDRAVEIFNKVRENAPFGEYADKAQFMVAECHKKSGQYGEAAKAFQKMIEEYPRSNLMDSAIYEVAQCTYLASLSPDYDQELTDVAIKEFKGIAEENVGSSVSDEARAAVTMLENRKAESIFNTAEFYKRQKKYKSAVIYYREVLEKYPYSPISEKASSAMEKAMALIKEEK